MRKKAIFAKTFTSIAIMALVSAALLFAPTAGHGILIKPAGLDHLVLEMPASTVAGESFGIGVKAYDANNNLITNYDQTGRDIQVSVSGAAKAAPSVLKASAFSAGGSSLRIEDTKAENITLTLYDTDAQNPIVSVAITIVPNKLDHFSLEAPGAVVAGERFNVKVVAQDRFGNTVTSAQKSATLKVHSVGAAEIKGVTFPDFVAGESSITAMSEKAGKMYVEVIDTASAVKGRGADMEVAPAALDHFAVTAPSQAEAGKPFETSVVAYDRFQNVVRAYASLGKGIEIVSSGGDPVSPAYISPGGFQGGSATVALTYEKAGDIALTVTEKGGSQRGRSTTITVQPSGPDHFVVSTPEEATAGAGFRLKIEAYDRFGNLIKDYNRTGADVHLKHTGTGSLTPSVVAATDFVNGAATVDVNYDKAENISITASLAVEKAMAPAMTRPAAEPKKAMASPPARKPEPVRQAPPVVKPEKKVVKKVPAREVVKEQRVFAVRDIKLIEAGPRALVVVKVPNLTDDLKYSESLESIRGKDWIKLSLSPAEIEMVAQPAFESDLIGEVDLKEDRVNMSTDILIELLPKRVQYSIKRDEGALVVDVLRLGVAR